MKVEPGNILKLFLNFSNFEPQYSYRHYSYKKKSVYENGWFLGQIEYFNKTLVKYRVTSSDDSEDYIGIDDIDGVEIMLLD